mmetsp:Transcript_3957/g.11201  ORF Transcript_3957/g.11201 Transcript_3957/m.11201 type:complete len:240 (+) Transcript_3957:726-1445(+)
MNCTITLAVVWGTSLPRKFRLDSLMKYRNSLPMGLRNRASASWSEPRTTLEAKLTVKPGIDIVVQGTGKRPCMGVKCCTSTVFSMNSTMCMYTGRSTSQIPQSRIPPSSMLATRGMAYVGEVWSAWNHTHTRPCQSTAVQAWARLMLAGGSSSQGTLLTTPLGLNSHRWKGHCKASPTTEPPHRLAPPWGQKASRTDSSPLLARHTANLRPSASAWITSPGLTSSELARWYHALGYTGG